MGLRDRYLFEHERCFFVTTTCSQRKQLIHLSKSYQLIQDSLAFVSNKYHTAILGYVIMPNHIHLLIHFKKENRLSDFMRDFKKFTSTKIRQALDKLHQKEIIESIRHQSSNRAFQVWQDRFDDVFIYSISVLENKLDYIHLNPLQEHWSLVKVPEEYKYSSASFYELGLQNGLKVTDYRTFF